MAPEQLEGREADARTDVFAFGLVLHEMITGRKVFDGKTHASLIAAIMHVDPQAGNRTNYAVGPGAQRFLINTVVQTSNDARITVVLNWPQALRP